MQPKATSALDHGLSGLCSNPGQDHCLVFFWQDSLLSQCLLPPRCVNGYWRGRWGPGLEKNLNSSLRFRQAAVKLCLPLAGKVLIILFTFSWQTTYLELGFAHWASENDKLLAQQENLLFSDDLTALFSSPIGSNSVMDKHPIQGGSKNTHSCFMV